MMGDKYWRKKKKIKKLIKKKNASCGKSASRSIEIRLLKVHFRIAISTLYNNFISLIAFNIFTLTLLPYLLIIYEKNIEVVCIIILFYYFGYKHLMNVKAFELHTFIIE